MSAMDRYKGWVAVILMATSCGVAACQSADGAELPQQQSDWSVPEDNRVAQAEAEWADTGLLSCLPADALAVAVSRIDMATVASSGILTDDQAERLWAPVDAYLAERIGVSVWGTTGVSVWATPDNQWAACFRGADVGPVFEQALTACGCDAVQVEGAWMGRAGDLLVVGTEVGVRRAQEGVEQGSGGDWAASLLQGTDESTIAVMATSQTALARMGGPLQQANRAVFSFSDGRLSAAVEFVSEEAAGAAYVMLQMGLQAVRNNVEDRAAELMANGGFVSGLTAVTSMSATAVLLDEMLVHSQTGSTMRLDLNTREGMTGSTTTFSLLAAVGIPAFLKFVEKAKTNEAGQQLRLGSQASASYFQMEHVDRNGQPVAPHFPPSSPRTPGAVPCDSTVVTPPEVWSNNPTWASLDFSLTDPHRYAYQYDSSGSGETSQFTISAFGDLDCDGVYSTFVRFGRVDSGAVVQSDGVYEANELE